MEAKKPKDYTFYMIGHGHIDPTWLWCWEEGYEEVRATFRSALERMNETPEFRFSASSACFYQWAKECEPEMFEEIKARVKEGRWELVGGWWVEPDCNIPSGEAFARHGLYSQRFFQKEFGVRAKVGFNPDTFGHAGTLPQIYKKMGIDYYAYMRPSPVWEMDYPDGTTFWWKAGDGSAILACCIDCNYGEDQKHKEGAIQHMNSPWNNPGQRAIIGFYGVGNHGGGPTKRSIKTLLAAKDDPEYPNVELSTLEGYFKAFQEQMDEKNIPTVSTDLQHHARGCYSVHAGLKKLNRQVEHALVTAERFASGAWLLDAAPYPTDLLHSAWTDLLYNQFHDILAGTSLESSYEDTRDQLGGARHRADCIINFAIQSVSGKIDTTPEGNTLVVFNPLAWPVTQAISIQPIITRTLEKPVHFVDDEGQVIPSQLIRHERTDDNRYSIVAEVPAMGYRCYHARAGEQPAMRPAVVGRKAPRQLHADRTTLENEWWRIEIDPYDGHISRLYDKKHKVDTVKKACTLAAIIDGSDTWSHEVRGYRSEAGRFANARIQVVECGDILATLQITSTFEKSTAIQEISIYRDLDTIDYNLRVNWQEMYHTLKLGFETNVKEPVATYDVAYGHQQRPTKGEEEPGQQWFDMTGKIGDIDYGFAVANDCKYGFDTQHDGVMRVTVLRSPAYAHHDDGRFDASKNYAIMDQGWHSCAFLIHPHAGAWQDAGVVKQAWELNVPLIPHIESAHPGELPSRSTLMGTEADNVLISVVKKSEDGDDLIIRGYETAGRPAKTVLHIPSLDATFDLEFTAHEIKTVRINPKTKTLVEVNLLEETD